MLLVGSIATAWFPEPTYFTFSPVFAKVCLKVSISLGNDKSGITTVSIDTLSFELVTWVDGAICLYLKVSSIIFEKIGPQTLPLLSLVLG